MRNQLRSANLLYPRLAGVAFKYKLRPLDDNPIEHTGLQYARQRSNTKRRLYFCHLSLSLATSLKVNSHHKGKQGLPRPVQILGECLSLTSVVQGLKKKKNTATIRNASTVIFALRNESPCICPYDLQQKPTHFLEGPLQEVRYSHQDPFHWIPSGSKDSWLGRAGNAMIRGASVLSTIVHHSRPVAMQIWWRMQMYTHRASKTAVYNSHGVIFARAGLRWLVKRIN